MHPTLGNEYPFPVDQDELASRLGFVDCSQLARDILRPAKVTSRTGESITTAQFWKDLQLLPAPDHYRVLLLAEFVRRRWWDTEKKVWKIPEQSWPRCVPPAAALPHPDYLQEWHFRERARSSMLELVPLNFECTMGTVEVACHSKPFHLAGGDYYQVWSEDRTPGSLRVLIGDVTGKHQAAAQVICEMHGFFKSFGGALPKPVDCWERQERTPSPFFAQFSPLRTATMIAAELDTADLTWRWSNAALFLYSDGLTEELTTMQERNPDALLATLAAGVSF